MIVPDFTLKKSTNEIKNNHRLQQRRPRSFTMITSHESDIATEITLSQKIKDWPLFELNSSGHCWTPLGW